MAIPCHGRKYSDLEYQPNEAHVSIYTWTSSAPHLANCTRRPDFHSPIEGAVWLWQFQLAHTTEASHTSHKKNMSLTEFHTFQPCLKNPTCTIEKNRHTFMGSPQQLDK